VASGNFETLYSTEALNLISALLVTKRFTILSWYEWLLMKAKQKH